MAHSLVYTYDAAGNRLTATNVLAGATTTFSYDAANQLTSSQNPSGTTNYEYDAAGNLTKISSPGNQVTTYTWDDANRRTRVQKPGGTSTIAEYNGEGMRVRNQVAAGLDWRYVWDGMRYLIMENAAGTDKFRFTCAPTGYGETVSEQSLGDLETFYYHFDGAGSTRQLTLRSGSVINDYVYSAFGELQSGGGPAFNPFTWNGRVGYHYDADTVDYYVRARIYDPVLARWLSHDPLGWIAGVNLYSYVRSSPIIFSDPSGLQEMAPATAITINARDSTEYFEPADARAAYDTATSSQFPAGVRSVMLAYYLKRGRDARYVEGRRNHYEGNLPRREEDCPRCVVVWVHGYQNSLQIAEAGFASVATAYRRAGGRGQVYGFAWNADPGPTFFWGAQRAATLVAEGAFSQFMEDFQGRCPNTQFCLAGHSLGARVVLRGLSRGRGWVGVAATALVSAAVDNESLEPGEEFGNVFEWTGRLHVAYNPYDSVLNSAYVASELGTALGRSGAQDPSQLPRDQYSEGNYGPRRELWTFETDRRWGFNHSAVYDPDMNESYWRYFVRHICVNPEPQRTP